MYHRAMVYSGDAGRVGVGQRGGERPGKRRANRTSDNACYVSYFQKVPSGEESGHGLGLVWERPRGPCAPRRGARWSPIPASGKKPSACREGGGVFLGHLKKLWLTVWLVVVYCVAQGR